MADIKIKDLAKKITEAGASWTAGDMMFLKREVNRLRKAKNTVTSADAEIRRLFDSFISKDKSQAKSLLDFYKKNSVLKFDEIMGNFVPEWKKLKRLPRGIKYKD